VLPLLDAADDQTVIIASGDEMSLEFAESARAGSSRSLEAGLPAVQRRVDEKDGMEISL